jgi:hypothetical protein
VQSGEPALFDAIALCKEPRRGEDERSEEVPMSVRIAPLALALVLASVGACDDRKGENMTEAWEPDGTGAEGSSAAADDDGVDDAPADDDGNDDGSCATPCTTPPGDCFEDQGSCATGQCVQVPVLAGDACSDGCTGGGFCDATGNCICVENCAATCLPADHMTAACDDAGMCVRTCEAPYQDCDADPANGCEVPVGVAHQCDVNGLNAQGGGCWTAYCGESQAAGAFNFGTYHCIDCSTCGVPSAGQCHWCNHDNGNWFPTEACACGAEFENAVCAPG